MCWLRMEQYSNCIAELDQALLLDSTYYPALFNRALVNDELGEKEKACRDVLMIKRLYDSPIPIEIEYCL